jgi:hypothetical protein
MPATPASGTRNQPAGSAAMAFRMKPSRATATAAKTMSIVPHNPRPRAAILDALRFHGIIALRFHGIIVKPQLHPYHQIAALCSLGFGGPHGANAQSSSLAKKPG